MTIALGNTASGKDAGTAISTLTVSHNVAAGSNLLIACFSWWKETAACTFTSLKYNGVDMTEIYLSGYQPNYHRMGVYYLINPPAGAHNLVLVYSAVAFVSMVSADFGGVKTSGPISDLHTGAESQAGTDEFTTVPNGGEAALVLDCLGKDDGTEEPVVGAGYGMTEIVKLLSGNSNNANNSWSGIASKPGAASVTSKWTWGATARDYMHATFGLLPLMSGYPKVMWF